MSFSSTVLQYIYKNVLIVSLDGITPCCFKMTGTINVIACVKNIATSAVKCGA